MQNTPITSNVVNLDDYRKSKTSTPSITTQWKENLIEELSIIIDEWKEELTVDEKVLRSSIIFINKLPYNVKVPSVAIENQNAILFEWSKKIEDEKVAVFSVIIEKDRIIYSTYNLDIEGEESRGVLNMSSSSIKVISNFVLEYFKQDINNAQRNRHTI